MITSKIQFDFKKFNIEPEDIKSEKDKLLKKSKARLHSEILDLLIQQLKPLDFEALANPYNTENFKLNSRHLLVLSIENILNVMTNNHWGLCKNQDFIYLYNGVFWKEINKETFQIFLGEASEKLGVTKFTARYYQFREQLFKQFLATAYLPTPESDKDKVLINLLNGTFEISSKGTKIKPFNQMDFITYQLPFEYNPTATAPLFDAYLKRVLPDKDSQKVLSEYLGYVFLKHGNSLKLESALILYGLGANGKSVFFEIVNALLGKDATSSYSLQELTDNTGYYRAMIANKLVNYSSEINGKLEVDMFKRMVSGEVIPARLPYGKPMQLTQYAKFIFNCNELPKDVEYTNAYFRRWIIIPFNVTIPKSEQDTELHTKIINNELSGVFNWVLGGLKRLLDQKRFTECDSINKALEQYRIESDSIQIFLNDAGYKVSLINDIPLKELFNEYRSYCIDSGFKSCSLRTFADRLRHSGYTIERRNFGNSIGAEKISLF